MTTGTFLLLIAVILIVGSYPAWPHSRNWGFYPSSSLGLVAIVILVLVLTGRV